MERYRNVEIVSYACLTTLDELFKLGTDQEPVILCCMAAAGFVTIYTKKVSQMSFYYNFKSC